VPNLSPAERSRYARHLLLDPVGPKGQAKLKASSVLCIGAGGLGSPVLMYLAAAGVGRIGVVDPDRVEASNLQRQILHGESTLGHPKVESARARLADINPHVHVEVFETALSSENALQLLADWDVVVDGSDNFPTRYLVNDACVLLDKPLVYGSIYKFEGQMSVFNYRGGPNYRDLFPEPPPPGAVPSCAEAGVLGVLPAVVGSVQATETLKILLDIGESLSGRLLLYDALNMRFRELKLNADPKRPAITRLIDYAKFCGMPRTVPKECELTTLFSRIPVADAAEKMTQGWKPFVLDVRRPAEAEIVAFEFADRLQPHDQIQLIADDLPRDRDILVHCKLGGRSDMACEALAALGFDRLFSLDGGIVGWAKEINPDMPTY
jgi:molybdopterin/thiamine biosynthesis adenylyltransferase/rhodanese-related sulfurtransferase